MTAVMRYTVVVRHPETDIATAVLAGEPVPEWANGLVQDEDLTDGEEHDETEDSDAETEDESSDETDSTDEADEKDDEEGSDEEPEAPDYESKTNSELEAEIARRNKGREEDDVIEVEGRGNKADLVAALVADDARAGE